MPRDDYGAARTVFHTSALLTVVATAGPEIDGVECRVCGESIDTGESIRKRQHHLEYAHATCGWLKDDEREIREVRRPGTHFVFFQWGCPACDLDACSVRRPFDGDDRRCRRCAPLPEIGPGVTVETLDNLRVRYARRLVIIPMRTRGVVLARMVDRVTVRFVNALETLEVDVAASALVAVLRSAEVQEKQG